jgi:hypothetical protein
MEGTMGRRPVGTRAMTTKERQQRHIAKLVRDKIAKEQEAGLPPAVPLNLEHLRRYPDRIAPWLVQRLGPEASRRFHTALGRALDDATMTTRPEAK